MTRANPVSGLLVAAVLALTAGCGEDDRPESWSYVHAAIIGPSCTTAGCHNDSTATAGLELSEPEGAYAALVGHPCDVDRPEDGERGYVDPGSPERSTLLYLLRGDERGRPMPPDRLMPAADVDLVERWILEGAPCD
jgi:hypothetical protein